MWASGQRYSGTWEQDQPRGQGQMQFTNGNRYRGRVEDGVPERPGVMRHASGDQFTGQLKRGSPNGRGVYLWAARQRLEGDWLQGLAQGPPATACPTAPAAWSTRVATHTPATLKTAAPTAKAASPGSGRHLRRPMARRLETMHRRHDLGQWRQVGRAVWQGRAGRGAANSEGM